MQLSQKIQNDGTNCGVYCLKVRINLAAAYSYNNIMKMAEQLLIGDKKINEGRLLKMDLKKNRKEIGCLILANSGS